MLPTALTDAMERVMKGRLSPALPALVRLPALESMLTTPPPERVEILATSHGYRDGLAARRDFEDLAGLSVGLHHPSEVCPPSIERSLLVLIGPTDDPLPIHRWLDKVGPRRGLLALDPFPGSALADRADGCLHSLSPDEHPSPLVRSMTRRLLLRMIALWLARHHDRRPESLGRVVAETLALPRALRHVLEQRSPRIEPPAHLTPFFGLLIHPGR